MSIQPLSERITHVKPSATLAISAKAKQLQAEGKSVVSLSAGEPDFNPPEFIQQAAVDAIHDGYHKYTAVDGLAELKQAISNKFQRENQLDYEANQIIASTGAKQSIFNAMAVLLNRGDEVIIPAPYWVSYPEMVKLNDGVPVIIKTTLDDHYKIDANRLKAAITKKTKLLIMNSPSNPSGMIYSAAELKALAEVLLEHPQVHILSDDIYEHIIWHDEPFQNIVNVCAELYDRTIVINGLSKAYAMTGWRLGYAGGPAQIIAAMKKYQGQCTSGTCAVTQRAAVAALNGDQSFLTEFKEQFKARHDFVYQRLNAMEGVSVSPADGAFYLFPDVKPAYQKLDLQDDVAFCEYLLDKAGVAVVPGTAFGVPGAIRLSYAMDIPSLEKALDSMNNALST